MAAVSITKAPGYEEPRTCGRCCAAGNCLQVQGVAEAVGCRVDACFCKSDVRSLALSYLSSCVKVECSSNENDVTSYQSIYLEYCAQPTGNSYSTFTDTGRTTGVAATVTRETTIAQTVTRVTTTVKTLVPTLATFSSLVTYSTTNPDGSVVLITSTSATTAAVLAVTPTSAFKSTLGTSDKIALGVGLGFVLPALIATCIFGYLQLRYQKRKHQAELAGTQKPTSICPW